MQRILLIHTAYDTNYLHRVKDAVGAVAVSLFKDKLTTRTELLRLCEAKGLHQVLTCRQDLLELLLSTQITLGRAKPSLDSYAGSMFKLWSEKLKKNIEIVFINPLEHLVTVSYGKFLFKRYLSKFTNANSFLPLPEFNWEILGVENHERLAAEYAGADYIAVDIETGKEPYPHITEVGYTAVWLDTKSNYVRTHSCVIELKTLADLAIVRKFNELPPQKILQNGKYDCAYLSRYNAPLYNYMWDTATLMHCWYSELPKDLGFLGAFLVREAMYWKDLAKSQDKRDQLLYNCKDHWTTALAFLQMMKEMPQWAKENYKQEFPLNFPAHMCEMRGIALDLNELELAAADQKLIIQENQDSVNKLIGCEFNVNSPKQMKMLLAMLGCKDIESADAKGLAKAALRHPINGYVIDKILKVRKARKLLSTYLTKGKEFYALNTALKPIPRILYSLNPHGTDTGRLASKEHHFWCGLQVQNIPRGDSVKRTLVPDDGFLLVECDLEQAESRDTAHIAGDEALIAAVSGSRDFHSVNASAFFGVPYESIYSDELAKTIDKALRDLAKRVNHGANYNMGANVLVDTMGLDKIAQAQRILGLPKFWTPKQVAEYLLAQFHKTYPAISGKYYPYVIAEILKHQMLKSSAKHEAPYQASYEGWVRYCFGRPDKNKSDLNAYVAHCPQSLNAMTLNKAFMWVFYDLAFNENFKLLAQIHDSILFQVRIGHEYLIQEVVNRMQIPVTVTGADGKDRRFVVPAAAKAGKDGKGATRWSLTE